METTTRTGRRSTSIFDNFTLGADENGVNIKCKSCEEVIPLPKDSTLEDGCGAAIQHMMDHHFKARDFN